MSTKRLTPTQKAALLKVCDAFTIDDYGLFIMGPWVANGRWAVKTDQSFGYWRLYGDGDDERLKSRVIMTGLIASITQPRPVHSFRDALKPCPDGHEHTVAAFDDGSGVLIARNQIRALDSLQPEGTWLVGRHGKSGAPIAHKVMGDDIVALVMPCPKVSLVTAWLSTAEAALS